MAGADSREAGEAGGVACAAQLGAASPRRRAACAVRCGAGDRTGEGNAGACGVRIHAPEDGRRL